MNHERSPSASVSAHPDQSPNDAGPDADSVPSAAQIAERRKRNRENFNKRRGELLDDLLQNLDVLVYAQLSAIYYMDCALFRFLFRSTIQFIFLSPKPAMLPEPPSANRPYIGGILGSNLLCFLLHGLLSAPSAGEATRGYLHGWLIMDFIGQIGPTSKLLLLFLDLVVLVLQIVQLSVHLLRQRLKENSSSLITITTTTGIQYGAGSVSTGQDLDDEERGVRHSAEQGIREDIEMQTLNPAGALARSEETNEASAASDIDSLLVAPLRRTDAYIFDAFNSGQIVVADLDLLQTVKEQIIAYQKTTTDSNAIASTADANRILRERLTQRITGLNLGFPTGRTLGE